ncbi:TPA: hypothetical protein ACVU5E_002932, partial [Vibrio parahaemolyticus]
MALQRVGYSELGKEYKGVDFILEADERLWGFVVEQLYYQSNVDLHQYEPTRILNRDLESPYTPMYSTRDIMVVVDPDYISQEMYMWLKGQGFDIQLKRGLQTEEEAEIIYNLESIFENWY